MVDITRPNFGKSWAEEGEKVVPPDTKVALGWVQEMMPYQWENYLQNRQDEAINYLLQKGVPEWNNTQEYTENKSVVTYLGHLYMATSTVVGVIPTVAASWKKLTVTYDANGTIPIAFGGTGANTVNNARANLGIGTLASQAANAVNITGGTINATPIGATNHSTGRFSNLEVTGVLNATSIIGPVTGTATSAARLTTPRTISISGAVTGTPTSFDGTSNIEIQITALDVAAATTGVLTVGRGGTGTTTSTGSGAVVLGTSPALAGVPTTPTPLSTDSSTQVANMAAVQAVKALDTGSAATALTLKTARTISLSGGATGTPTAFNGGEDISIPVTSLDGEVITRGNIPEARMSAFAVTKTSGTGSAKLPSGTTAQRDVAPSMGALRSNSTVAKLEWYNGTEWVVLNDATAVEDVSSKATRFKAILDLKQRDPYLLIQGDSTGNEDWEFFYLTVQKICAMYPTHTVYYRVWNPTTKVWDGRTLQTGTTSLVLRVYNGSVPGATPAYWQGVNKDYAYDGFQFDMIIVNYGLNVSTDAVIQKSSLAACLYTLRSEQPDAEILVNIQCPDYTDATMLSRSQMRSDAQRQVIGEFGVASVDVFDKFSQLVNASSVEEWYGDRIHPNPAGQEEWSRLLLPYILKTTAFQKTADTGPTLLPNGNFQRWYSGSPVWWTWNVSGIVSKETSDFETGTCSVRVNGTGANTGLLHVQVDETLRKMQHLPQVVFAARVKTTGTTSKPGTLLFSTGSSGGGDYKEYQSEGNGYEGVSSGRWRWVFLALPRQAYRGKSNLMFGIMSGQAGESVLVDRVICGGNLLLSDSNITDGYSAMYEYADSSFDISANSTTNRQIGNTGRLGLQLGASISVTGPVIPSGVIVHARVIDPSTVRISYTNTTSASVNIPSGQWQLLVE